MKRKQFVIRPVSLGDDLIIFHWSLQEACAAFASIVGLTYDKRHMEVSNGIDVITFQIGTGKVFYGFERENTNG